MTPEIQKALEELFRLRLSEKDAVATAKAVANLFEMTGHAVVPVEPTEESMAGLVGPQGYCSIPLADAIRQWIRAAQEQDR